MKFSLEPAYLDGLRLLVAVALVIAGGHLFRHRRECLRAYTVAGLAVCVAVGVMMGCHVWASRLWEVETGMSGSGVWAEIKWTNGFYHLGAIAFWVKLLLAAAVVYAITAGRRPAPHPDE